MTIKSRKTWSYFMTKIVEFPTSEILTNVRETGPLLRLLKISSLNKALLMGKKSLKNDPFYHFIFALGLRKPVFMVFYHQKFSKFSDLFFFEKHSKFERNFVGGGTTITKPTYQASPPITKSRFLPEIFAQGSVL